MKKLLVLLWVMLFFFGITGIANAALYDRGGGLIYDSDLNITWLQDANYAQTSGYDSDGKMTYDNAVSWADTLSYYDSVRDVTWDDWRLPTTVDGPDVFGYDGTTTAGYNITTSEMGYMYYVNLGNLGYYATDGNPQQNWGLHNTSPFTNLMRLTYWSGTENPYGAWFFNVIFGLQSFDANKNSDYYAWAVRPGDVSALVANAGADQNVEQESCEGAGVTLDGSGSTVPDNDIDPYEWFEGDTSLGTGETLNYTFPLGIHTITLLVTDSAGNTDEDEVIITIEDTTPAVISGTVRKDSLWPPNHKMVDVGHDFEASDSCDSDITLLIEVTSDEPTATAPGAGGSTYAPDAEIKNDDSVLLRAERSGMGDGRVYEITVTATDPSGNSNSSSVSVKINHDKDKDAIDSGQNYDATQIN